MSTPHDARLFACSGTPGCQHGDYLCTKREELKTCFIAWDPRADVRSRGACTRSCHFLASCRGYSWTVHHGCRHCMAGESTEKHSWSFGPTPQEASIVEWHHGWFMGPMGAVRAGKIDLISEGYISPDAMGFQEKHVLVPSGVVVTYAFSGDNCLLTPWSSTLQTSPPVPGTTADRQIILMMAAALLMWFIGMALCRSLKRQVVLML